MRISAKADYAVRAVVELAASSSTESEPAKGDQLARAQAIPPPFLENILAELRVHGLVQSRRGSNGGYWLAKPAAEITIADVIRAVEGPLATVRGESAEELEYRGTAAPLQQVWLSLRSQVRDVLEAVTVADVISNAVPPPEPLSGESSTADAAERPSHRSDEPGLGSSVAALRGVAARFVFRPCASSPTRLGRASR